MLKLKVGDKVFEVSSSVASGSKFLKEYLSEGVSSEDAIPLPNISVSVMTEVLAFLEHYSDPQNQHSKISKPLPSADLLACGFNSFDRKLVEPWDQQRTVDVLNAANFLDIKELVDLAAARVASIIRATPIAELKRQVGITEITPEWMEKVRKENPWCKNIQK